jgi:protein gp37
MNELNPPALVRPAKDLAVLAAQIKADLAAEDNALRESSERARRAGEKLRLVREELAPRHRWNAWLKEQGIQPTRAQERIRIYDNWGNIPTEIVSSGVSRVLEFLRGRPAGGGPEPAPPKPPEPARDWTDDEKARRDAVQRARPTQAEYLTQEQWHGMNKAARARTLQVVGDSGFNYQGDNPNIEWALWSWNPVTGCLHNCPYCYARDGANLHYPQKFVPSLWPGRLKAPHNTPFPKDRVEAEPAGSWKRRGLGNVFVCSMADLFGRWVPAEWIEAVLKEVHAAPQWNFLFLTKFPVRMAEFDFPANAWVGTTVDCQARVANAERSFRKVKAGVKWLSIEPMLEPLKFSDLGAFDWAVIGGSSHSTQTPEWRPPLAWVTAFKGQAVKCGVPVYMKANLLDRLQQYPGDRPEPEPKQAPAELRYLPMPEK